MAVQVERKPIIFSPDSKRVLARFFQLGEDRSIKIIRRVLELPKNRQNELLNTILRNFSKRHRSVVSILEKNFRRLTPVIKKMNLGNREITYKERLIIGAYFTMEYSIEAAAFFNPSIIEDIDQSQLRDGEKRVILSFRATGEGHVSSIVFRSGVIDEQLNIHLDEVGRLLEKPKQIKNHQYEKEDFLAKLVALHAPEKEMLRIITNKLTKTFTYEELRRFVREIKEEHTLSLDSDTLANQMMWLASSHYEMTYSLDTAISERVIFPLAETEIRGIEDARFVRFQDEKGHITYYATYTAYDGFSILPKLLSTKDFIHFKVQPINGKIANKGAALFPRKINGKYAMLSRVDGENNYISFSDSITNWHEDIILLQEPKEPWEFVQLGNCGSPVETEKGWLVITHSVGPMRMYTLSAALLDLEDPTKIIGRSKQPILSPTTTEREGYVPNVVYSCGQMIHNGHLIIPYAMSDYASSYATVNVEDLLAELLANG